jgi:hypothetical protein
MYKKNLSNIDRRYFKGKEYSIVFLSIIGQEQTVGKKRIQNEKKLKQ